MNNKIINILLPQIEGVDLRSATVDLKKGVITVEYEEEGPIEAKIGDFLTLKTNPSKVVIFEAMAGVLRGVDTFTIIYDLPTYINGEPTYTLKGVRMPISRFRHSTEEEKALMIEEMEKLGKRYNPKTFKIEDIGVDISKVVADSRSAIDYLLEDTHRPSFYTTKKQMPKLEAISKLLIIAEAWNSFDEFKPNWENTDQRKNYPAFEIIDGKLEFSHVSFHRWVMDPHISSFSFKTRERAEEFGRQFIDLFRIVLTN